RSYLGAAGRGAADEQDLAGETFIRALHHLDRYEDPAGQGPGFEAWLLSIARHLCLDHLRRERRRAALAPAGETVETPAPGRAGPAVESLVQEREALRLAALEINALPPTYRAPFKLLL